MNQLANYYKGKRVLITGHTGFKGVWLSAWLNHLGADVVGYALEPPSKPNNPDSAKKFTSWPVNLAERPLRRQCIL